MWIHVYPSWKTIINSKSRKRSFCYETKSSIHLSQWGEWICGAQSLKEKRLLCESVFIPIERWTLINGRKISCSYVTKASIHLSQWEEWIYGAQSNKERILLCESVFILIERWTLILKIVEREVFLMKWKLQCHLSP